MQGPGVDGCGWRAGAHRAPALAVVAKAVEAADTPATVAAPTSLSDASIEFITRDAVRLGAEAVVRYGLRCRKGDTIINLGREHSGVGV